MSGLVLRFHVFELILCEIATKLTLSFHVLMFTFVGSRQILPQSKLLFMLAFFELLNALKLTARR
jgi:hypothetical protein